MLSPSLEVIPGHALSKQPEGRQFALRLPPAADCWTRRRPACCRADTAPLSQKFSGVQPLSSASTTTRLAG